MSGDGKPIQGEVIVTGTPGGDGECWHFVVNEDEHRRVVGESMHKIEMDFRHAVKDDEWAPTPGIFYLGPDDLLRAAGHHGDGPVTLRIRVAAHAARAPAPDDGSPATP